MRYIIEMDRGGYVYIMTNKRGGVLYIGVTADISARVFQHNTVKAQAFAESTG